MGQKNENQEMNETVGGSNTENLRMSLRVLTLGVKLQDRGAA